MAAMHWRGCTHPAALFEAPTHPAITIVHWLSEFSVVDQVEFPRDILNALAHDIVQISALALAVTTAMAGTNGYIAMLPELLEFRRRPKND